MRDRYSVWKCSRRSSCAEFIPLFAIQASSSKCAIASRVVRLATFSGLVPQAYLLASVHTSLNIGGYQCTLPKFPARNPETQTTPPDVPCFQIFLPKDTPPSEFNILSIKMFQPSIMIFPRIPALCAWNRNCEILPTIRFEL